jgi:hypothetical protein
MLIGVLQEKRLKQKLILRWDKYRNAIDNILQEHIEIILRENDE